jgi:SMI1-KNR4 cell-wall
MLEKWKSLLADTQIDYKWTNQLFPQSPEQLSNYENQVGFLLPSEYKEFCQVFGYGTFTKYWITLECPDLEDIEPHLDTIAAIKCSSEDLSEDLSGLLDSAYIFGTGDGFIFFLFDLRTYSGIDKSYDIYVLDDEHLSSLHYLGRQFFDFVQEMCTGERTFSEFPALINSAGNSNPFSYEKKAFMPYPE